MRPEGLGQFKKIHLIGTWTRDLPACSIVPFFFILVCEAISTEATPGLLCQPRVIVQMIVEKQMECRLAGNTEVLGGNLPQRHFCPPQNPTWPDPGLNPGRRGRKPATNRLSYGAAPNFPYWSIRDSSQSLEECFGLVGETGASCYVQPKNQPPELVVALPATRWKPYWASAYLHSIVAVQLVVLCRWKKMRFLCLRLIFQFIGSCFMSRVYGSVINNNGFWIGWLDLLTTSLQSVITINYKHSQSIFSPTLLPWGQRTSLILILVLSLSLILIWFRSLPLI
jgi:hypothetical protein